MKTPQSKTGKALKMYSEGNSIATICRKINMSFYHVDRLVCNYHRYGRLPISADIPDYVMTEDEISERPGVRDCTDWGEMIGRVAL